MIDKHKRALSIMLTVTMFFLFWIVPSERAFAQTSLPAISSSKYIKTYTYSSSGKVYAYKESSLKNKTGGYISCSSDECRIIEIKGQAVKVSYPVSGGRKTAWFEREAFTYRDLASDGAKKKFICTKKVTTYKWKNKNNEYGSISSGDTCYLLRGDSNSDWLQLIYPVSGGYKMAWAKGSDISSVIWPKSYLLFINGFSNDSASTKTFSSIKSIFESSTLTDSVVNLSAITYNCEGTGISQSEFEKALKGRLSQVTSGDTVIIYLAAHGTTNMFALGNSIYLYSKLLDVLCATKCGKFILLLEPCKSGSIVNSINELSSANKKRFYVLTSSDTQTYGQYIKENYFLFGKAIEGGLSKSGTYCNSDWNDNREVTVKELADYVTVYMKNKLLERKKVLWFDFSVNWDDQVPVYYAPDSEPIFKY